MFSSQKAVHEIQLIEHDFVLSIEDAAGAFSKASNPHTTDINFRVIRTYAPFELLKLFQYSYRIVLKVVLTFNFFHRPQPYTANAVPFHCTAFKCQTLIFTVKCLS